MCFLPYLQTLRIASRKIICQKKESLLDINFEIVGGQSRTHPFTLSFDAETMSLQSVADRVVISVQAQMEPNHRHWRDPQIMDIKPVLLSLNGVVYNSQIFQGSQGV